MLRVEVNGLLHDWFDIEELGDMVKAPGFGTTLRENIARYFGVPVKSQAVYDEDGLLATAADLSRALQRYAPKLYVYNLDDMGAQLRQKTKEQLAKIEGEVEQTRRHFHPRVATGNADMPSEATSQETSRPSVEKPVEEVTTGRSITSAGTLVGKDCTSSTPCVQPMQVIIPKSEDQDLPTRQNTPSACCVGCVVDAVPESRITSASTAAPPEVKRAGVTVLTASSFPSSAAGTDDNACSVVFSQPAAAVATIPVLGSATSIASLATVPGSTCPGDFCGGLPASEVETLRIGDTSLSLGRLVAPTPPQAVGPCVQPSGDIQVRALSASRLPPSATTPRASCSVLVPAELMTQQSVTAQRAAASPGPEFSRPDQVLGSCTPAAPRLARPPTGIRTPSAPRPGPQPLTGIRTPSAPGARASPPPARQQQSPVAARGLSPGMQVPFAAPPWAACSPGHLPAAGCPWAPLPGQPGKSVHPWAQLPAGAAGQPAPMLPDGRIPAFAWQPVPMHIGPAGYGSAVPPGLTPGRLVSQSPPPHHLAPGIAARPLSRPRMQQEHVLSAQGTPGRRLVQHP